MTKLIDIPNTRQAGLNLDFNIEISFETVLRFPFPMIMMLDTPMCGVRMASAPRFLEMRMGVTDTRLRMSIKCSANRHGIYPILWTRSPSGEISEFISRVSISVASTLPSSKTVSSKPVLLAKYQRWGLVLITSMTRPMIRKPLIFRGWNYSAPGKNAFWKTGPLTGAEHK